MGIQVEVDKCDGCGECVPACPFGLLELAADRIRLKEGCTLCGSCRDACTRGVILIETVASTIPVSDSHRGVWVFAEQWQGKLRSVSYELLAKGRELADSLQTELGAVCFGHNINVASLTAHGADKVYLVNSPEFALNPEDLYTQMLVNLIQQHKPEVVLAGATALGRSLIPRVAARLEVGLTADCTGLAIDMHNRQLLQTRPTFGGNIMATIVCPNKRPQMSTVRPRVFKSGVPYRERQGQIINADFNKEQITSRTRLLNLVEDITATVKLGEADIIVSGGRGLGKPENFKLLEELAGVLGAALGSSRPPVDEGWIPYSYQVGQSGKTVGPKVYIACGISGAFQHIVGMQTSDIIVVINNDPDAPIFEVATYGVVGDLFTVVPMLIEKLRDK